MCLFPIPNNNIDSVAFKKGVTSFKCGACPECLRERSSAWALRSVMEARCHRHNCMITLTYDKHKYDPSGHIVGEEDVNPNLKVRKDHIQKFIKRLRKHFEPQRIKYIACAEYGSRTHRAHYHCILFGVNFSDRTYYKKSKRGNPIYMSKTLTELWTHGICTIDSINVFSAVARYCTKYCAKQRSDETFMLCSQGIGLEYLMRNFNGKNYMIDGREYTVPRIVWQQYISNKYKGSPLYFSYKYVNFDSEYYMYKFQDLKYISSCILRQNYINLRDNDSIYKKYIEYWKMKAKIYEQLRAPVVQRIYNLPESKYHFYKTACLEQLSYRFNGLFYLSPGSNCKSHLRAMVKDYNRKFGNFSLAVLSRPNTASDTIQPIEKIKQLINLSKIRKRLLDFQFSTQSLPSFL